MKIRFTVSMGIFAAMALSNAIVPVLPAYASDSAWQGTIYAAYFLGAFITTLPGGILSDRYGRVPVIRTGLFLTLASGILLTLTVSPVPVIILRGLEGLGTGLFVAAAMSYVNSLPDHARMSGYFLALLNLGLVLGLIISGWLAAHLVLPVSGILLFTAITGIVAIVSLFLREPTRPAPASSSHTIIFPLIAEYRWLWFSSVILVGITGVVISTYPEFSGLDPGIAGIWIAIMSVATIIAVMTVSRLPLPPVPTIRISAILMIPGIFLLFLTPLGFIIIGALSGIVMIAQMAFLSEVREHQGVVMGLFSTTSYLGMAILPFIAGIVADRTGFLYAFCGTAFAAVLVALTIGRCSCRLNPAAQTDAQVP